MRGARRAAASLFYTPLGRRLLALFVLCAVLPVTLLAVLSLRSVSGNLRAATNAYLRQEAKSFAMSLLERLDLLQRELVALERGVVPRAGEAATSFRAAGRVSGEGVAEALVGSGRPPTLDDAARARLRSGRPVLLVGSAPPAGPMLVLPAAEGGFTWGQVGPEVLWKRGSTIPPRVELSVLSADGVRLIGSGGVPRRVEEELIRRRSTSGEVAWRDQRGAFQGAYWTIPMDGNFGAGRWVVSLHIPAEQAAAPVRDFRRLFGWVVLLSLLVSVLAASASIRRTLAPLDHLVDATRRLGDQDFAVELPAAGPAELRQLSAAFTTMAGRLRHQFTALEHERARLAGLVEHSPYGVLLIDAGGRIELTNELGRGYLQQLGIDPAAELHTLAGWSVDGLVERGDWQQISLAGASPREFVVAASGLADGASATSRVVVLRDVTEEQRLQRQLEQGERLAAVGRLAAGMAHDLNNILQGIGMCSQLLRPALSNDTARADLDAMQQLQDRAAALIRQVLDFTRQSESSPREVGLVPAVEEAVALLRRTLPADVHVESTAAASTDDVLVRIDPGRLQQVLTNLAVNARDAMPAGGSLRLAVDLATPPAGNAGEWVCLSVRDTGTGIPLELQGKVFDPFFTTKPVGRGTGLGLAQVYGIVVQHQGRVELSSTPGAGTEVRILLPVLRRAGAPGHGDATGNGTRENGTKGNGKSEEGTTGVSATLGGRSPSP